MDNSIGKPYEAAKGSYAGELIRRFMEAEAARYADDGHEPEIVEDGGGPEEWTEEQRRRFEEISDETIAKDFRAFQLPEDMVLMISSDEGIDKLRAGEYSNEEPSGLSDDEIIRKAKANDFSARSIGPRFEALMAADPQAVGDDVFGAIFELFTILAFWSGRCAGQMVRIFRRSALSVPELYEYFREQTVDDLALVACAHVRDRPVYRKPEVLSRSGQDQNAIIINTGYGYAMLGDYHPEDNPRYVWNDIGIANLFADVYKDTVKYCTDRRRWYVYDGKRWVADDSAAMECCKELTLALYAYSRCFGRLRDDDDIKPQLYQQYVKRYHSRRGRENILKDASSVHTVTSNDFDTDRYLFNCRNGTYHLRTKRFTSHSPSDMITKLSGVLYNKYAECARWERHIDEVTEHEGKSNAELAKFIKKCLGYTLTGDTKYECGFVFYGPTGRNGKSLTLDTYLKMMGDYGCSAAPDTITQSRFVNGSGPKENIARLAGVRFVSISEPDKGMQLSESTVKTLTGNDRIVARRLNEGSVEYYPQFKLFINTNYRPLVTDKTVFSRLKIIPFRHHFEEKDQDTSLKEELARPENLSGIFNWCCAGLDLLESEGFGEPEAVQEAKELYMEDNNVIGHFIKDNFILDKDGTVPRQDAYSAFKVWYTEDKDEKISKRTFLQMMETVPGIEAVRVRVNGGGRDDNPRYCFKGIRWRDVEAKAKKASRPRKKKDGGDAEAEAAGEAQS